MLLALGIGLAQESGSYRLDLDRVFRCGAVTVSPAECAEARALIMQNCNACHTFLRLVRRQHAPAAWRGYVESMGSLAGLGPEQKDVIARYLAENFHDGLPPPELPPDLALVP